MAKSKGTKRVVWVDWTVRIFGRKLSGRGQFNADRFLDYKESPVGTEAFEYGLNHIAGVIKGMLAKGGELSTDELRVLNENKRLLNKDNLKAWIPEAGPRDIPRGRAPKSPDASRGHKGDSLASTTSKKKGKSSKISPDQEKLF